ncbi:hypothetical protein C9374_011376 [Naegleria lovaniensis]|uniref:L-seryl-tRNA(Sec) kinase n=1 Tax=Naegleria lovaniensis TaxID=51637 RepID=A0AA88H4E0_NAELO|nr:uncharacterized protein C9374_011376 [Naegleria lovaniensis]KAG2392651.1 hypothetical protein C9374_011376 [Naegleria lovaniensis]
MGKIVVCLLYGLPASGKSSVAKLLEEKLKNLNFIVERLEYDQVLRNHQEQKNIMDFSSELWKESRQVVEKQTIELVENYLSSQDDKSMVIILDDNFYYKSMRHEFVQICRNYTLSNVQLLLKCPVDLCIERDKQRRTPVGDGIIMEMSKKFEYSETASDEFIFHVEYDTSDTSQFNNICDSVIQVIHLSLDHPLQNVIKLQSEMREESQRQNRESFGKCLDDGIRKQISYLIEHNLIEKTKAKQLSIIKRDVLKKAKKENGLQFYFDMFDNEVQKMN